MLPTIAAEGEVVLVDKISPQLSLLKKGQVIVACSPNDPNKLICKRIVGMPGDRVTLASGSLWSITSSLIVPPGQVWLEGDNPSKSLDSREFGPLPMGLIRGRALCKVIIVTLLL